MFPEARVDALLTEQVGGETVVYDSEHKQAHCLNPLASAIFSSCDGRTSIDELAELAAEELGEPVSTEQVSNVLAQLEERELLDVPRLRGNGISRRDLMRKTAVAGAAALSVPVITTIIAPTPAAAATQFCTAATLCKCCEPQCGCNSSGNNCCTGQGCNCTANTSGGTKHCKPANAGASTCAPCINTCNCTAACT
jgi:hypothetical protein